MFIKHICIIHFVQINLRIDKVAHHRNSEGALCTRRFKNHYLDSPGQLKKVNSNALPIEVFSTLTRDAFN